jgi:heme A synthase
MAAAKSSNLPAPYGKWLRRISLLAVGFTFVLVILGGVVRVTGSGLGCPDWPFCYGKVIPPLESKAIIEYTHRFVASVIVGPLILLTFVIVLVGHRRERWLLLPTTLAVVLLIIQGLLGGVTVLTELPGGIVALHLAVAQALLACLVLIMVVAQRGRPNLQTINRPAQPGDANADPFPHLITLSGLAVYILLLSGSYVTATGALAACPDWPLCQGLSLPSTELSMIHMMHRVAAAIIGLLLLYALHLGFRDRSRPREVRLISLLGAAAFLAQVLIGALSIWLGFPVELRALHLALATLVWLLVAWLSVLVITAPGSAAPQRPVVPVVPVVPVI